MATTYPTMPTEVPCPFVSGYGISTVNPLQSTTSITGRVRVRERWRDVPQTVTLTYRMTDKQVQLFEGFLRLEASNGAAPFYQKLRFPRSTSLASYLVQFASVYSGPNWIEGSHGLWEITCTAYTMEDQRPTWDEYLTAYTDGEMETLIELTEDVNTHWVPTWTSDEAQLIDSINIVTDSDVSGADELLDDVNTKWVPTWEEDSD